MARILPQSMVNISPQSMINIMIIDQYLNQKHGQCITPVSIRLYASDAEVSVSSQTLP